MTRTLDIPWQDQEAIRELRRTRMMGPARIAQELGLPLDTVTAVCELARRQTSNATLACLWHGGRSVQGQGVRCVRCRARIEIVLPGGICLACRTRETMKGESANGS